MMADYSEDRAEAYESIKEAGVAMVLRRSVGGEYNPATLRTAPATVVEYPCYGIIEEYDMKSVDNTLILSGDKKITLAAAADFPDPQKTDILEIGGEVWKVQDCKPLAPAGVAIMYVVQVRQ